MAEFDNPNQMENRPLNLIKTIIAGLLIAILSTTFGYHIRSYLDREKLSIANISVRQKDTIISIPRHVRSKIEFFKSKTYFSLYSLEWDTEDLTLLDSEKARLILMKLSARQKDLGKKIKVCLNDLETVKKEIEKKQFSSSFFRLVSEYGKSDMEPTNDSLEKLRANINKELHDNGDNNQLLKEIICEIAKLLWASEPEGEFQIEFVMFNSGNRQGIIKNRGELLLGNEVVNLKKKRIIRDRYYNISKYILSRFLIIEPNSFFGMTLVVDDYNNKQKIIDQAKAEYKIGQHEVRLILSDINNKNIESKPFILRNDLADGRKETLKEFLRSNYSEYLQDISK